MVPNFIIIGAQKSASTYLQTCLAEHQDIYMPHGETSFFETPDYESMQGDMAMLEKLFEGISEKKIGIKRPSYIGKPEVPERIESCLPDAKLIAVLRNPVERAISAYYHYINNGFIPAIAPETGLYQLITNPVYLEKYKRAHEIIEFGYYHKYLSKYNFFSDKNQLMVLFHEDILASPLESVQKVCGFLDVDPDFIPHSLNSRPQAVVYNLARLKLLRLRNRSIYDCNPEGTRLFPKNMSFSDKIIARIVSNIDDKVLSKILHNEKPKISEKLHNMLYKTYELDIAALESLTGRELDAWKII